MNYGQATHALPMIIHYSYDCEHVGTIMIGTKELSELDLKIVCDDDGREISIPKIFNNLANRLDFSIDPKLCRKYLLTVKIKNPNISYTILASADDMVTLPLNK